MGSFALLGCGVVGTPEGGGGPSVELCAVDADCDDALFCTGAEVCVDGVCESGTEPCTDSGELCDENADECVEEPVPSGDAIFLSESEIMDIPMSGSGWDHLLSKANKPNTSAALGDTDNFDVDLLAKALVAARKGLTGSGASYRADAADMLRDVTGEFSTDGALAHARNMAAIMVAADLIDFNSLDPSADTEFRRWAGGEMRYNKNAGNGDTVHSINSCAEIRPNNWGTHCRAAEIAIVLYLRKHGVPSNTCTSSNLSNTPQPNKQFYCENPQASLDRLADIYHGWLGNRDMYNENSDPGFSYGVLSWQADPSKPVGINPKGAIKNGRDVDGLQPEEQRRADESFSWPPKETHYLWEALQGTVLAAEFLHRAGYDAFNWEDQAVKRAADFLHRTDFDDGDPLPAEGDDTWQPWLLNFRYGTSYPAPSPSNTGKNWGYTDFTHGPGR